MGRDDGVRATASELELAKTRRRSGLGPRPIDFGVPVPIAANDSRPDPRTLTGAINIDGTPALGELGEPSATAFVPGSIVPGTRYRIIQWLGEGGMGVVYEAEHIDIERRVALKFLQSDRRTDSDTLRQFRDEARAASKMGSEHVVDVFDFQELEDGHLMFAMELLTGTILRDELALGPLYVPRTLAILRQVCKGLAAAHDANIIHRDVKPENIALVERKGRRDFVKLLDFGIAAMVVRPSESGGERMGTPWYMAPELLLDHASWDLRVDIYSVGCTAYEALVGRPPFEGRVSDIVQAHISEAPPGFAELGCTDVHPALEAVVMRCLSKDPARRYANARELEAALCEAQVEAAIRTTWDDLPLPEVDAKRRARLRRAMPDLALYASDEAKVEEGAVPGARVRAKPIVAATAVSLAAVAAALWITTRPPPPDETPIVQTKPTDVREPPREPAPAAIPVPVPVPAGEPARDPDDVDESPTQPAAEPPPKSAVEAAAAPVPKRRARSGRRRGASRSVEPRDTEPERPAPSAESKKTGARELLEQAAQAKRSGDKAGAARLLEQALLLEPRNVTVLSRLSDVMFDRGKFQDAAHYAEKAVSISPRNARLRLKLGDAYFKLRNYPQARKHYEVARELGSSDAQRRLQRVDEKGG